MKPPPPVTRVRMASRTLVPGPPPPGERRLPCLNVSGQTPARARGDGGCTPDNGGVSRQGTRRIAVVPAYNEEPTVEAVLDRLYPLVDELVVVDDGSTDHTRKIIEEWLPGAPHATLLTFDQNRGMSAAYYEAFTHLAARLRAGEISPDDRVFTVDADGQHELAVFDMLSAIVEDEGLDALLVRRDLSTYPRYKRAGNWLISAWASLWAGYRLKDVESGYRVFRAGALV